MSKTKYWVTFSILEAENLPAGDSNGLSDPYVTVDLSPGNQRLLKTSVKPETLNPKWGEDFHVEVELDDSTEFHFSVKDKDFIGVDHLGYMVLPAKTLLRNGEVDEWFPLTKKLNQLAERGYGNLKIKVHIADYTPPTQSTASRTTSLTAGNSHASANRRTSTISQDSSTGDREKRFLYEQDAQRKKSMIDQLEDNTFGNDDD